MEEGRNRREEWRGKRDGKIEEGEVDEGGGRREEEGGGKREGGEEGEVHTQ